MSVLSIVLIAAGAIIFIISFIMPEMGSELDQIDPQLTRKQIKEMIDTAEREANIRKETIINAAKDEAKRRLENVEQELIEEKKSMEKEIREEIVNIAFQAAEKIVQKEINQDKYLDIVDDILKGAIAE